MNWCAWDFKYELQILFDVIYKKQQTRTVLELRADGKTLAYIGNILGLSRERVRQIELRALTKLKHWLTKNNFIEFITAEQNGNPIISEFELSKYFGKYSKSTLHLLSKTKKYLFHIIK